MRSHSEEERVAGAASVMLTIPGKAEYIALCRLALTGISRVAELDDDVVADLKLALTEACSNSIRHGYAGAPGVVEVRYELTGESIVIDVTDEGPGFQLPAERANGDFAEGGLGIAIIRALVDELSIEAEPGNGGARLRLVKYLG